MELKGGDCVLWWETKSFSPPKKLLEEGEHANIYQEWCSLASAWVRNWRWGQKMQVMFDDVML